MLTWQWCGFFWTYLLSRLENYFKSKYSVNRQSLSLLFSVIPRTDHSQERNCIKIMPVKATTQESRAILNAEVKHGCSQLPSPWADRQGKSHVPVAHAQCPAQYSSGHQGPAHSSVRKYPLLTGRSELVKSRNCLTSTPAGPTQSWCLSSSMCRLSLHQFTC